MAHSVEDSISKTRKEKNHFYKTGNSKCFELNGHAQNLVC